MTRKHKAALGIPRSHLLAGLAGVAALLGVVALLGRTDSHRAESEIEKIKRALRGTPVSDLELPQISGKHDDVDDWKVWGVIAGRLLERDPTSGLATPHPYEVSVMRRRDSGWDKWRPWESGHTWLKSPELDAIASDGECDGSLNGSLLRVVCPFELGAGEVALISVERWRR